MSRLPGSKRHNGEVDCGVYYDCGKCTYEQHKAAWRRMTPAQRDYDRMVDPFGAFTSGFSAPGGDRFLYEPDDAPATECSCHINPPCSFCTSLPDPDADPTQETPR